jgi:malonyl-CoA O-methyltransferase
LSSGFVDRQLVGRRFSRVASTYPDGDFFAREIDRRMQERLDYVNLQPRRILDLGCSRGGSFSALTARYPEAELIGLDLAPAMLAASQPQRQPGSAGWALARVPMRSVWLPTRPDFRRPLGRHGLVQSAAALAG